MNSVILQLASKYIRWIFIVFAFIVLFRGHNLPGGGFIGGLLAGLAIIFNGFAFNMFYVKDRMTRRSMLSLILGMASIILSFIPSLILGEPFMKGEWLKIQMGALGVLKLGTPTLFDVGVFLIVTGVTLLFFVSLTKRE
jgi:multicomponent Na+:H+ antiporter subunit B